MLLNKWIWKYLLFKKKILKKIDNLLDFKKERHILMENFAH